MSEDSQKTNGAAALKKPARFSISQRWESSLYQGLVFHLRPWTERRASRFHLALAPLIHEQQALVIQCEPFQVILDAMRAHFDAEEKEHGPDRSKWVDYDGDEISADQLHALAVLQLKVAALQDDQIRPEWVRYGVHMFEGFYLDGEEVRDIDLLLEHAPDDLLTELQQQIQSMARLDEDEAKNSESPSTSQTSVDGETPDTTAENAGREVSTGNGTAVGISPMK